jgi:quercetin dioxygenase-like cupin family protein
MPFTELNPIQAKEIMEGFQGKFVHGATMTASFWKISEGSILPKHSHIHEQISIITAGKFELTIGEETRVMEPGTVGVIPSNIEHEGRAISDCTIIDIFCPAREEYTND